MHTMIVCFWVLDGFKLQSKIGWNSITGFKTFGQSCPEGDFGAVRGLRSLAFPADESVLLQQNQGNEHSQHPITTFQEQEKQGLFHIASQTSTVEPPRFFAFGSIGSP